jgi:hypothetical protein
LDEQQRILNVVVQGSQEAGSALRLKVVSASMQPLLKPGEALICQAARPEAAALYIGDLVVLRQAAGFLTHRLVRRDQDGYLTKGDRSQSFDPRWSRADFEASLVGVVTALVKGQRQVGIRGKGWSAIARWVGWLSWLEGQSAGRGVRGGLANRALGWGARLLKRAVLEMLCLTL